MPLVGFVTPMGVYLGSAFDKFTMYKLFEDLKQFLNEEEIPNKELITDRMYKRYIRPEDLQETINIMKRIENGFLEKFGRNNPQYTKFFDTFYRALEDCEYLIEIDDWYGRFQIGMVQLPFASQERRLPNEIYDEMGEDEEPLWMRDIWKVAPR